MSTPAATHRSLADAGPDFGDVIAQQFATVCRAVLRGKGVTDAPGFIRIITGEPHPFGNFALVSSADGGGEAVAPLAELPVPSAVVFAAGPGEAGESLLAARGYALAHAMPAMAVEISSLAPAALPAGYRFDEVDATADREWCDAFATGYEIPRPVAEVFGPAAAATARPADPVRHFAIRRDGAMVATSLLYLEGGLAGIYCVSTVPAERRRGLGAYATAEPLRRAGEMGYRTGILQSSEMGAGVYKGLGFETFGTLPLYVRIPA